MSSTFDTNILGQKISEYRKLRGYSQRKLATKLQKGHSYINEIEHGNNNISITSLIDICNILECTPNDLLHPFVTIPSSDTTRIWTDNEREHINRRVEKRLQFRSSPKNIS